MPKFTRIAMLAAALTASAAGAQTPAADNTIIVNGKRLTKPEVRAVARGYTRGILAIPEGGQHARWKAPVCPGVIGLAEPLAATVVAKVRAEAVAAGVRVGKPGCKRNFDIVFTDDVDAQMNAILKRSRAFTNACRWPTGRS